MKNKHPIVVRYKGRVAQVLALIVLSFILCRVPFTALIIRRAQLLQRPAKTGGAESIYVLWYVLEVSYRKLFIPFLYIKKKSKTYM